MEIFEKTGSHSLVRYDRDELSIMNNALNEVLNGIDLFEFETRIGESRGRVEMLLKEVGTLLDEMDSLGG